MGLLHFTHTPQYFPLVRNDASLVIPLFDPVSVKAGVLDEFDNTPAPGAKKNSLFVTLGFSVAW